MTATRGTRPGTTSVSRRLLLGGLLGTAALTGCAGPSRSPESGPGPAPDDRAAAAGAARFAALESRYGTRLGVFARDTGGGATVTHRADERFPICSTHKVLSAAAALRSGDPNRLLRWGRGDLIDHSPVTTAHLATGLTLGQLADAAVRVSDNTAANLLLAQLGGPSGVTAFARSLGDGVTRLDRTEPTLNEALPGDERDTSTPRALGTDLAAVVLGPVLAPDRRDALVAAMVGGTTGAGMIRAGTPAGWRVGDKTGSGDHGVANDIAVLWPPARPPVVLTVLSHAGRADARTDPALLAEATRAALAALA